MAAPLRDPFVPWSFERAGRGGDRPGQRPRVPLACLSRVRLTTPEVTGRGSEAHVREHGEDPPLIVVADTPSVLLADWRSWWKTHGQGQLFDLLAESWDPFADTSFREDVHPQMDPLGRRLHEGANTLDVQVFLHDLRHTKWPNRTGRKWTSRDRAVGRKVVTWYREATGEHPSDST